MADSNEPSVLDPALTLGPDDPLRAWADQNIDWRTGRLLVQDPSAAIESMIKRGIPPPDVHAPSAMAFADPAGNEIDPSALDGTAATAAPPKPSLPIVRTNPDGSIAGNITAPRIEPPKPKVAPASGNSLDPEETSPTEGVPLPKPRPTEAGLGASDVSARKKDVGGALSDFSKSLTGVKPVPPPPLNPVGTPSVRSPSAISAPQLAQLLALTGNVTPPSVAQTLGRLLVAGKA